MLRTILVYGVLAGLVVTVPMFVLLLVAPGSHGAPGSLLTGYSIMLVALSFIFVGVKRYRDKSLGGVIKFVPALLAGLGISVVAGVMYVVGWEIVQAATHDSFAASYAQTTIEAARAKGYSAEDLAKVTAEMAAFQKNYANPLYRLPMTFVEIFPVGVVISLVAAALLRNSRFLPARAAA